MSPTCSTLTAEGLRAAWPCLGACTANTSPRPSRSRSSLYQLFISCDRPVSEQCAFTHTGAPHNLVHCGYGVVLSSDAIHKLDIACTQAPNNRKVSSCAKGVVPRSANGSSVSRARVSADRGMSSRAAIELSITQKVHIPWNVQTSWSAMNTDAQSGLAWVTVLFLSIQVILAIVRRVDGICIQQCVVLIVAWCTYLSVPDVMPVAMEWAIVGVVAVVVLAMMCCFQWCCSACVTLWEPLAIFIVSLQTAWLSCVAAAALLTTDRMHIADAVPNVDHPGSAMYAPHVCIGFSVFVIWASLWRCVRARRAASGYSALVAV